MKLTKAEGGQTEGRRQKAESSQSAGGRRACLLLSAFCLLAFALTGCNDDTPKYNGPATGLPYTPTPPPADPVAEIKTELGDIQIQLFENDAPNTVANFIELADKKFFDGLKFHRIIKNFMIQGGDPKGDGTGGPGYKFPDEIDDNPNDYSQYMVAMANSGKDTNGSQFFIISNPKGAPHLKRNLSASPPINGHTVFGKVIKGQDIVDKLEKVPVVGERPTPDVKMISVSILSKRSHKYEVTGKVMDPPPPAPPKAPEPPPGEKKDDKKSDAKPDDKKPDAPKSDAKPDEKKPEDKKPDDKKPEEKK